MSEHLSLLSDLWVQAATLHVNTDPKDYLLNLKWKGTPNAVTQNSSFIFIINTDNFSHLRT